MKSCLVKGDTKDYQVSGRISLEHLVTDFNGGSKACLSDKGTSSLVKEHTVGYNVSIITPLPLYYLGNKLSTVFINSGRRRVSSTPPAM